MMQGAARQPLTCLANEQAAITMCHLGAGATASLYLAGSSFFLHDLRSSALADEHGILQATQYDAGSCGRTCKSGYNL